MIEALKNLREIPVTVYRHTDDAAPVLEAAEGSLKNLLKACLVTGYGSQQSLGWEMPFEEAHRAAFRSTDETSNRHYLYVANGARPTADVFGAATMNGLDEADFKFGAGTMPIANGNRKTPWILVGHEKAFVLLMQATNPTYYPSYGAILYFGDVPSLLTNDKGNTVLNWRVCSGGGFSYSNDYFAFDRLFFPFGIDDATPKTGWATSILGRSGGEFRTFFVEPPEGNGDQYLLTPAYIAEGSRLRALWPGIFIPTFRPTPKGLNEHPVFTDFVYCPTSEHDTWGQYVFVHKRFWLGE